MLGLAAAGTQGGAIIGALLGGWLADKLGRRIVFLSTMGMFVIFALAQALVPNMTWLVVIRLILGVRSAVIFPVATRTLWRACPAASVRSWAIGGSSCSQSARCSRSRASPS